MKHVIIALASLLVAASVNAQTIHGHPQLVSYASPAEWPTDSAQCHWTPADAVIPAAGGMTGHTHLDLTLPRYAETAGESFRVAFAIKSFHTAGEVFGIDGALIRDVVWDATGTATPPPMVGDPMGLKVWTGHLTIDPLHDDGYPITRHGWFLMHVSVVTRFTNGTAIRNTLEEPLFSVIDPTVEQGTFYPMVRSTCNGSSKLGTNYGAVLTEYRKFLPLAPISTAWPIQPISEGYGGQANLADGVLESRFDLDLHNGVPGTTFSRVTGLGNQSISAFTAFDPGVLGLGKHKIAQMRVQANLAGTEQFVALLVTDVTVATLTPPTTCQDVQAVNLGGLLPCVFPVAPPPPVDVCPNLAGAQVTVPVGLVLLNGQCVVPLPPPTLFHLTITCDAAGKCQLVVT